MEWIMLGGYNDHCCFGDICSEVGVRKPSTNNVVG